MLYRALIIAFASLLTACASQITIIPDEHKILLTEDTLVYEGMITGDAVLEAIRLVRTDGRQIKKLRITSEGGEMGSGIEFGYFVHELNLDVEVSQLCFSACANYILPAANHVLIKKEAMLGWHGGAKQDDEIWRRSVPASRWEEFSGYLNRLRLKETAFFDLVGVDQDITVYGQTIPNNCQFSQKTQGWIYSLSDMRAMGIKHIEMQGDELTTSTTYKDTEISTCLLPDIFK
ncbi:hypothetical protein ACU6DI_001267 [Vibrio navarrensis]